MDLENVIHTFVGDGQRMAYAQIGDKVYFVNADACRSGRIPCPVPLTADAVLNAYRGGTFDGVGLTRLGYTTATALYKAVREERQALSRALG